METLVDVRDVSTLDGLLVHRGRGTGDVALLHRTITYDHHLVEHLTVFLERDVVVGLACRDLHLFIYIANKRHDQRLAGIGIKREVSVEIGSDTVRCTLHDNTGSDNGALRIDYSTCNLFRLLNVLNGFSGIGFRREAQSQKGKCPNHQRCLSKVLIHTSCDTIIVSFNSY